MNEEAEMIQNTTARYARVTPKDLDKAMSQAKAVKYHRFPGTSVTACCVTLANGFSLVGIAAGANLGDFDEGIGREVAYDDAREQLWPLLGYKLKENIRDYDYVTPGVPPIPE